MYRTDIGVIGLAVMGRSIALNMADHGFKVGGYNRSRQVTERLIEEHPHENLVPFYELKELVASQERPRKFLIMVKEILFLKIREGGNSSCGKRESIILEPAYPAERRGPVLDHRSCRAEMRRPMRILLRFWRP